MRSQILARFSHCGGASRPSRVISRRAGGAAVLGRSSEGGGLLGALGLPGSASSGCEALRCSPSLGRVCGSLPRPAAPSQVRRGQLHVLLQLGLAGRLRREAAGGADGERDHHQPCERQERQPRRRVF